MKKFLYKARDLNGKIVKGTYIAENEEDMKRGLAKTDLFLESYKALSNKKPSAFFSVTGKVSTNELCNFCTQFSAMITAGIAVIDCIRILKAQSYSGLLRKTLEKVEEDLSTGIVLSESMKKYPKVFPNFFISMIYVGETSGHLDKILISITEYYTRRQKNSKKIKNALAYPIVLTVLVFGVLVVMLNFVIPTFMSSFAQLEVEMPALTMKIFRISQFVQNNWKIIFLSIFGVCFLIFVINKTRPGRYFFDALKLRLPIFKQVILANFTSTFTQSFGLLLSSGLDMVSSLDAISRIIDNKYLAKQFLTVKKDVEKGLSLSDALSLNMKLSPILIQMILIGEQTGTLDLILIKTYDYFDSQIDSALSLITTFLQPILLMTLGVVIAVIFISIYMPILNMVKSLKT